MKLMLLISLIYFSISNSTYARTSIQRLHITHKQQHTGVWCWAATMAMVGQFLGNRQIEDCEVLTYYFRYIQGTNYNCCNPGDGLNPYKCMRPGKMQEMSHILYSIMDIDGTWHNARVKFKTIVNEVNEGYPVIAALENSNSGHVVVVSGYDLRTKSIYINDPLMRGVVKVKYNRFLQSYNGMKWKRTMELRN